MRIHKSEDEGGCGVVGFASTIPVKGKHIFEPSVQMHNRGNGKGGGIAAVGLSHEDLGVTKSILEEDYLLQIALLDPEARIEIEAGFITPLMDVDKSERIPTISDYRTIEGLETKPPDVWRYFVRVKADVLDRIISETKLEDMDRRRAEDEFIYQNSFKINRKFYASLGDKRAFVLSHGRNMMILKIVGYAENIVRYYKLEDFRAHVWIAHQRYPTRGRVWHPGGAHPFVGMHEALVHNGDFANYHSIAEYLEQRGRHPLFLTDTEVSVLLFDLLNRKYNYPLEYIIEAVAPTTEFDFDMLPPKKQEIYHAIQTEHIHGSPDGPWFFIIARNEPYENYFQLMGITDTSMLRPQVFALIEGEEAYVMGNAAGRPLINAVGKPRVVINGTCLDYLAESFMAGDPLNGGGFVVVNGLDSDGNGNFIEQDTPYPGSNLFSLASGGAIYIRDPHHKLVEEQLNGGEFSIITAEDWAIISPYLEENERLFGISIEDDLLVVNGDKKTPQEVYRKVRPMKAPVLVECEEGED